MSAGHLFLTDFGLAKVDMDEHSRTNTFCGSLDYMAPEIIKREGHSFAVDWWSLGILIHDMLVGKPPFRSSNRKALQEMIVKGKFKLPGFLSGDSASLIKSLLVVDPAKRLGSGVEGVKKIKAHKFFAGVNWKLVANRELEPPFVPELKDAFDLRHFNKTLTEAPVGDSPSDITLSQSQEKYFEGFTYVRSDVEEHMRQLDAAD